MRALALPAAVASAAAALLGWLGLLTPAFTDYELEAEPALHALRGGHVSRFIDLAPAYGGSLVERAPFAFLPGGSDALFRWMAVPCLLAGVALGLWLFGKAGRLGVSSGGAWATLLLVAANPLSLKALDVGHPEEILVGVLVVAAALLATSGRAVAAGVVLGLAVAGKPWAVVAVIPVLALLSRPAAIVRGALTAGAAGSAILAPLLLAGGTASAGIHAAATTSGTIFQPWQLFWFTGDTGHVVRGTTGIHVGYRAAPEWIAHFSHPAVLAACLALGLAGVVLQRLRHAPAVDGLALLAAVLLARCLLDTWNTAYYAVPFLLALLVWELHALRRGPILTTAATLMAWLSFDTVPNAASPDLQAAFYLAWTLPLAFALTWRALSGAWPRPIARRDVRSPVPGTASR